MKKLSTKMLPIPWKMRGSNSKMLTVEMVAIRFTTSTTTTDTMPGAECGSAGHGNQPKKMDELMKINLIFRISSGLLNYLLGTQQITGFFQDV